MGLHDIPDRVTADLRRREAEIEANEYTPQDLKEAREDLLEKLLDGDFVGFPKVSLKEIIDQEINDNYAWVLAELRDHFSGIGYCDKTTRCEKAAEWMRRLCEAYLDRSEELVEERAAEIAGERLEDGE